MRRPNAHLRSAVLTNTEEVDSWMRTCGSGRGDGFAHDSEYQMLRELVDQLRHDNDELRREVDLLKCRVSGPRSAANVESSVSTQVA